MNKSFDEVWQQARNQVWYRVRRQVGDEVWGREVTWDEVGDKVADQVLDHVLEQVEDQDPL